MSQELENINRLIDIIAKLRAPNGCPWDREQNHLTLRECLLEETYEVLDALNAENDEDLKEELGDLFMQVIFHAQIAAEENRFDIEDVAKGISDKLVRRHPHVFSDIKVNGVSDVLNNWDEIKKKEKTSKKSSEAQKTSAISGVAKSQPALMSAYKISKKAVKAGFEWPDKETLLECVQSELDEFKEVMDSDNESLKEEEIGDLFFAVVNLARWHKINPELALLKANEKFTKRFQMMEKLAEKDMEDHTFEEYDALWKRAKKAVQDDKKINPGWI